MNHRVMTLKYPVTVAGITVAELRLRNEVVAGDLRGIKLVSLGELPTDDLLKLGGRLSGQPDAVMNALRFPDLAELAGVIGGFLGDGAATGTSSLPPSR